MEITQIRRSKHWHFETGYEELNYTNNEEVYPYRTFSTGKFFSLRIILKILDRNIDHLCTGQTAGFRITFHAPYEPPQTWKKYYHVAPMRSVDFMIDPMVITASDGLRSVSAEVRKCFFTSERKLEFFKIYTQQNCELECLSNITLVECGCVKFSMASKCAESCVLIPVSQNVSIIFFRLKGTP